MKRDCEHGRLARSCEICELQKENAELREKVVQWQDQAVKNCNIGDKLKKENSEYRKLLREVSDILDDAEGYHSGDAMVISEAQEKIEKHLNRPEVKQILEIE